jgi:hypothetical protein
VAARLTHRQRPSPFAIAAGALLLVDAAVRLLASGPYVGATTLAVIACGLVLVPFLPQELGRPALRLAVVPALAIGTFSILLTTVSIVGIELTELTIRASVAVLVVACAAVELLVRQPAESPRGLDLRRESLAVAAVVAIGAFSFVTAWDVVGPFPPRGDDWAYYFLYADEVEASGELLVEDRLSASEGLLFSVPPLVGALYGGQLILDGTSSRSLGSGLALASAISALVVLAAVGALWGLTAGLAAGAIAAVAPIRLVPMYWHGLATTLALVFVALVVLALGLMFRGHRDRRTIGLLAFALAAVAVAHPTSGLVVAMLVALALIFDALRLALVRESGGEGFLRRWWRLGITRPVLIGVGAACVVSGGVAVHVLRQLRDLGEPVDFRLFGTGSVTWEVVNAYLTWEFVVLAVAAYVTVLAWRRTRRDPALLAVAALALAGIGASNLWRAHIAFDYPRGLYYLGLALVMLVGVAAARISSRVALAVAGIAVCAYFVHVTVGLDAPDRLRGDRELRSSVPAVLDDVRARMERGELPDARLVVTDRCLHLAVPYVLGRRTIAAVRPRQAGFERLLAATHDAAAVLRGGAAGRRVAAELGVDYVIVTPACSPGVASRIGGELVVSRDDVVVIRL